MSRGRGKRGKRGPTPSKNRRPTDRGALVRALRPFADVELPPDFEPDDVCWVYVGKKQMVPVNPGHHFRVRDIIRARQALGE